MINKRRAPSFLRVFLAAGLLESPAWAVPSGLFTLEEFRACYDPTVPQTFGLLLIALAVLSFAEAWRLMNRKTRLGA